MTKKKFLALGAAAAMLLFVGVKQLTSDSYDVQFQIASFNSGYANADVTIAGQVVGQITDVRVVDGQALVTATIDKSYAPLHAGTTARLAWRNAIGARTLDITPGAAKNPELPPGKIIRSVIEPVQLDDVLASLDAPTRAHLQAVVANLQTTLGGNEKNLNKTAATAGPLVSALGDVLAGVGQDGPAIRALVTDLESLTSRLNSRSTKTQDTILKLRQLVGAAASQQQEISTALDTLPGTVAAGTTFFDKVPAAVDNAVPLINSLQPTIHQLPRLAARLNPVLTDLRPTVSELRPTLASARQLLGVTPGLLDAGSATVPDITTVLGRLEPAVSFLRPYTPEVIGFLTNWTSLFSAKNSAGHYGRALVPASISSFNSNPTGIIPPGMSQWQAPGPGANAAVANGTQVLDANGDAIR
jgi:phospholipid/cholesterol/gamma-HCH transport system substrate-binding protein